MDHFSHCCLGVGFVPYLTDILSRAIPLLSSVKNDAHRLVWAHALCAFCESVREYATPSSSSKPKPVNGDAVLDVVDSENGVTESSIVEYDEVPVTIDSQFLKTYEDQLEIAYDVVFGWLTSREQKV